MKEMAIISTPGATNVTHGFCEINGGWEYMPRIRDMQQVDWWPATLNL